MRLGVLTSSRADYGVYQPLLNELKKDNFFYLEIIAFGTHLSKNHDFTINNSAIWIFLVRNHHQIFSRFGTSF